MKITKQQDKELLEFQSLMEAPDKFENGFKLSSLLGTLFLAFVMVPGSIYMGLVAGVGIGGAAQWVTVILFIEMAKRANAKLSRAQLFILFYIAGIAIAQGTPLIYRQFFVRSEAAVAYGINTLLPEWVAPSDPDAYVTRSFLQSAWLPVIGLMLFTSILGAIDNMILGYGLFKMTSDVERLPFPMAPMNAQGIAALAEEIEGTDEKIGSASRWMLFSIGCAVGMGFSLIYMVVPTLSGVLFGTTLQVFPIPFADFSTYTKDFLPAVATGICFDLGNFITGMVMPFYAMLGSFIGVLFSTILNPVLHHFNVLSLYEPGDSTVEIVFKNGIDFYMSFGIGLSLTIAVIGIISTVKNSLERAKERAALNLAHPGLDPDAAMHKRIKERGDIPNGVMLPLYFISTGAYILLSGWLIGWHPGVMIVLTFFGFIYTPLISYVTARLEGLVGQAVAIPYIRELSFIMSGYRGVAVWFIPVPMNNYGTQTMFYKQAELLGTKFSSIWKSNLILLPIVFCTTILFASFIWNLAEVPSSVYPYASTMWELQAKNECLLYSSTLGEYSHFEKALSLPRILLGFGLGMSVYGVLSFFNAPVMLLYGLIPGLSGAMPHVILPQFLGALAGKFYFQKRFGQDWRKYITVIGAGYFVGAGLIAMLCVGVVFLCKSASTLPY